MTMTEPVSFKLAKLIKEKGFDKETLSYYFEDGEFKQNQIRDTYGYYGEEYTVEYSELLENWNDKGLTKKSGDRCFGCNKSGGYFETFSAPTIAEVVMWLYKKHGFWINVYQNSEGSLNFEVDSYGGFLYKSPKEAYETAIEYTLNKLI